MIKKVFLDANIILDLIDIDRGNLEKTRAFVITALEKDLILSTSCDILTTVYYVAKRKVDKQTLVNELTLLLDIFEIDLIDKEVVTIALQKNREDLRLDLEDLMQSMCATMNGSDMLVSNDKTFYNGEILVVSLDEAMERVSRL